MKIMSNTPYFLFLCFLSFFTIETHSFRLIATRQNVKLQRQSLTKCNLAESSLISLAAGAFAGSIGVGGMCICIYFRSLNSKKKLFIFQ